RRRRRARGHAAKPPDKAGWRCAQAAGDSLPARDGLEPDLTRELVYRLTRAGFVVMRSEKSGIGDSNGAPCRDVGFRDEVSMFVSVLKKLKSYDFVDGENVFLFGHSAGGWIAPLVAATEPVKGIVVYGTVVRPFCEYVVENQRRNQWLRFQPD